MKSKYKARRRLRTSHDIARDIEALHKDLGEGINMLNGAGIYDRDYRPYAKKLKRLARELEDAMAPQGAAEA